MPNQTNNSNFTTIKKNNYSLSSTTVQKMITKLLIVAEISKPKLIEHLGITMLELSKLAENRASSKLIKKVSLPLVDRYCSTEFTD